VNSLLKKLYTLESYGYPHIALRNKKEVGKLLDLLKNDPDKSLRYAIPLEEHGYTRGLNSPDLN